MAESGVQSEPLGKTTEDRSPPGGMITIGSIEIVVFLIVCAVLIVFYISGPGGAWPAAVAACALSALGFGVVYLLIRSRTP